MTLNIIGRNKNLKHKYTIYKHIGNISKPNNGWTKELNYISWDDREPVYDIRTWTEDHSQYGKGVTLTPNELQSLYEFMAKAADIRMLWRGYK